MTNPSLAFITADGTARAERRPQTEVRPALVRIRYSNLLRLADEHELIPQAIFNVPIEEIANRAATFIEKGSDDLDSFTGVGLRLANVPFAFMRYRGHPEGTSSLYLPREVRSVVAITRFIFVVMQLLKLPPETLSWQRKDDPDL